MNLVRTTAFLGASLILLSSQSAMAAPQVLAIIASAEPVTLNCDHRDCGAEFTSYCLQKARHSPDKGTPYYFHDLQTVALHGVTEEGDRVQIPSRLIAVHSERYHAAVRLSVPRKILREYKVASLEVAVSPQATLIPEPVAGDHRPITESEIAIATGPLRSVGASIVESGDPRMDAARLASKLVNALPRFGRSDEATRTTVWQQVESESASPGYELAEKGYQKCKSATLAGMMSLRQCLGSLHDSLVSKLNKQYWNAVDSGS